MGQVKRNLTENVKLTKMVRMERNWTTNVKIGKNRTVGKK